MQTLIFSSQQPSKAKGFSLMELLIYLALAAVFIGGILTLTGKAGSDAEVRQVVQDLSDIDNALRSYYGVQRLSLPPASANMEAVVAAQVTSLEDALNTDEIITQFGSPIIITSPASSAADHGWPTYWTTYTGMKAETCPSLMGAMTGPISVRIGVQGAAARGTWPLTDTDHRADALAATDLEAFCDGIVTTPTYEIYALHRI